MERFIGANYPDNSYYQTKFKIQYGEIYRLANEKYFNAEHKFKIQYGEIYRLLIFLQ